MKWSVPDISRSWHRRGQPSGGWKGGTKRTGGMRGVWRGGCGMGPCRWYDPGDRAAGATRKAALADVSIGHAHTG